LRIADRSRLRRGGGRDQLNGGGYQGRLNSGLSPIFPRGYHESLRDLDLTSGKIVYSGTDGYAMATDASATGLAGAIAGSGS
jgi:hypothetical protein